MTELAAPTHLRKRRQLPRKWIVLGGRVLLALLLLLAWEIGARSFGSHLLRAAARRAGADRRARRRAESS